MGNEGADRLMVTIHALTEHGRIEWPPADGLSFDDALHLADCAGAIVLMGSRKERRVASLERSEGKNWLRANHLVGLVPLNADHALRISPKVSIPQLNALLVELGVMPSQPEDQTALSGDIESLAEVLVSRWTALLSERLHRGLPRTYVEVEEEGLAPRGRIDLAQSLTLGQRGRASLAYRFDDHSADSWLHRGFLETTRQLEALFALSSGTRVKLTRVRRDLEHHVSYAALTEAQWRQLGRDTHAHDDRVLLQLCDLLRLRRSGGVREGAVTAMPFLINMAMVFQKTVERRVRACIERAGWKVMPQETLKLGAEASFQPDLVLRRPDRSVAPVVVDAKYSSPDAWQMSHVAQVVAYATVLGASEAVLIYPSVPKDSKAHRIRAGAVEVHRIALDLALPADSSQAKLNEALQPLLIAPR